MNPDLDARISMDGKRTNPGDGGPVKQDTKIDVLLMSAMKSGSTYLARQFEKRSDVTFVPGQKIVTTPAGGGR